MAGFMGSNSEKAAIDTWSKYIEKSKTRPAAKSKLKKAAAKKGKK